MSSGPFFNVGGGFAGMRKQDEVLAAYAVIVLGIVAHWIWGVLIAGLDTSTFDFGTIAVIAARIVIATIAAAFSFTGIWKQLEGVDKRLRFFVAFTQGFAVDALTGPVVAAAG
jgi:membrane protease YdiL (CAAX protease family)